MSSLTATFSLILSLLLIGSAADSSHCEKSFVCGDLGSLEFPLTPSNEPECGLLFIDGCNSSGKPTVKLGPNMPFNNYTVEKNTSKNGFRVRSPVFADFIRENSCLAFQNLPVTLKSPSIDFSLSPNLTVFACPNLSDSSQKPDGHENYENYSCSAFTIYYKKKNPHGYGSDSAPGGNCWTIELPFNSSSEEGAGIFGMLSAEFDLTWTVSRDCEKCRDEGGLCLTNSNNRFECSTKVSHSKEGKSKKSMLIIFIAISGGATLVIFCLLGSFIIWRKKRKMVRRKGYFLSRNVSKTENVGGSFFFGVPVFSYSELEDATNHFDPSKELGDGGYGTVYYGKLGDHREVAIKRMYEHNYKRLEHFLNEIKILTGLRHPNLVSLYGCTSRRSRELLLVYEYVPNGTVAEHLHGGRAKEARLTWDVRLSIAIDTASALAYLHSSDIVHRDIKTSNILLDGDFKVKVADFGLSRLFPNDVTHISTAPQGTPGYVDPDYHQCYQLTGKSDVYSFGVVLIELISSMPAVDVSRQRYEVNLANWAMNRIRRGEFDELIDRRLGYEADGDVRRMSMCVAELAFRCLQLEKELRPSMDEVLEVLTSVRDGGGEGFEF